jgi:hypothetical protein
MGSGPSRCYYCADNFGWFFNQAYICHECGKYICGADCQTKGKNFICRSAHQVVCQINKNKQIDLRNKYSK